MPSNVKLQKRERKDGCLCHELCCFKVMGKCKKLKICGKSHKKPSVAPSLIRFNYFYLLLASNKKPSNKYTIRCAKK